MSSQGIYGEPIFHITKPFGFITYSIPSIEVLDAYEKAVKEDDIILEGFDEQAFRINADCIIAPWNYTFPNTFGVSIRYEQLFSFNVIFNNEMFPMPEELKKDYFHYFFPADGLYYQSAFDRETALLNFHQKVQNTRNLIIYSPNNEGVYTVIFSVPKRIPPKVKITFEESDLRIEILEISKTSMRFKVKDKYGQTIKNEKRIVGIELNARLL